MKTKNPHHTLVFIHGWCCAPSDFKNQIAAFSSELSIYTPDYSEFIINTNAITDNFFYGCVDQIKKEIIKQGLDDLIFIGHSMGGNMALQLATIFHDQTRGIVMIDTSVPKTEATAKKFHDFLSQLDKADSDCVLRDFIQHKMINLQCDDLELMKQIENKLCARWHIAPKRFNQLLADVFVFDSTKAIETCSHPLFYIAGTPASGDIQKLKQLNPKIKVASIESGHFAMLNKPNETNELLNRFFQDTLL
ncbi:MAG: hypothetical protein COY58_04375 [Gammaproteobacteria bacterium CG_4_10_14_0_8_um_filter_38_16]|nr:MAG: hypothetical protein COY58_04375 [Gammaproteobacteria bacterium CG_4_10_14_0_8_um_filter_38_16]PJA02593.1 MAG: hypothetical protein COX72_09595 [Gammaproteobacteria bacterium CG_4_10_14_0_2_um_filter_38_22]PJB09981.1 MAG: hypothetical protein CO120_07260 [Gammaproteobacteria bacterium CG_4_9_14_3_um_filter_38_9]